MSQPAGQHVKKRDPQLSLTLWAFSRLLLLLMMVKLLLLLLLMTIIASLLMTDVKKAREQG